MSGPERPQRRQHRVRVERHLAVGDVLDDQHAVAAAQLDQRLAPLERQRPPRRVLVLRDHVEELRARARLEPFLERLDDEPAGVHLDADHIGLGLRERHQRAEVGRRLDGDAVARVEQRLAEQRDALHAAAGDRQLLRRGPPALEVLLAVEQVLAHARDALARRVLERDGRLVAQQPRDDLVEVAGRERLGIREAAGHRERARRRPGEDRRQLGGTPVLCAARELKRRSQGCSPPRGRAPRCASPSWSARAASAGRRVYGGGSRPRRARSPPRARARPRSAPAAR